MFHVLSEPLSQITQHHRLDAYVCLPGQTYNFDRPFGTDFVAAADAALQSEKLSGNGTFCASLVSPYSITPSLPSVVIRTFNTRAVDSIGFPAWDEPGALSYIDGCSNTNLISPIRNGDACLNYLYFPPGTVQSLHTHPSVRIGVVLSGEGVAVCPDDPQTEVPLVPGTVFLLDRHTLHAFNTGDSHMSLFAFHPDSEAGPTDEGNPMKVRTYLR